ncbi:Stk1 family PASTA domain-containing Ser/Thr kinase [Herbivorax sp. ANBcel31]|uniref:Stk1 family PASTA domain-containing Ser/Thr kinase n=1 Tax=Herbivorax sp. ANBcel31 TaxID=3069754 RepID=UPI0027B4D474|nr:Stk1 family PASTA domain-containing Ser/Thr kinase [Herbivorax sp. ANBcel31]MDQ2087157.1 Stk1 family PASTA domain-containing Ser/Thr kinase [Herbivorax sp. ANBcel31]
MIGQILGSRYELIEKIGGGGMALVYKAKCKLLNRFVAVKILRPDFTNDEEFIKRFRIEAQAAASLSHPNIVSIYDVGNEEDTHYIVMEYVDGVTLKEYLEKKGKLNWKEAVNISIQISLAIEHAHKNNIVHRDIKPHNILFTKDEMVKVTDFGIARAVTSSTITMAGGTIGSVHYFSPEQARGGFTDEKSDIYSLGIVLYELLTGELPFDGDSPVAVAIKHIQDEPEEAIKINKKIPIGVNSIVKKAVQKDQNSRYQKSSEILDDLYRVLDEPNTQFFEEENIKDSPTVRVPALGEKDSINDKKVSKKTGDNDMKRKKKKDKITTIVAVSTSIIVVAVIAIMGVKVILSQMEQDREEFTVGDYIGMDYSEVVQMLEENNIQVNPVERYNEDVPEGEIFYQDRGEGETLIPGEFSEIEIHISKGSEYFEIPDFRRTDYRQAGITLRENGLLVEEETEYSDTVAIGYVIRTEPPMNESVESGDTVTVYRSIGPEIKTTTVPDLIGKTRVEATNIISERDLTVGDVEPEDISSVVDEVTRQVPEPGIEVNEGTSINLYFDELIPNEKIVNRVITLENEDDYGDRIYVMVNAEKSNSDEIEQIYRENVKKEDFPIVISIPVPEDGSTNAKVYLDRRFYKEFEEIY